MRLRVVSARNEIADLNPNEKMIHMAFRASNVDFLSLMQRCPRLRMIQVPPSYHKTMSKAIEVFLDMQGVEMLQGDVWGHRKDLNEYYTVPYSVTEKIREMKMEGKSAEDIEAKISRESKLNPEMVAYILTKEAPA